jgi:hypothetical protein
LKTIREHVPAAPLAAVLTTPRGARNSPPRIALPGAAQSPLLSESMLDGILHFGSKGFESGQDARCVRTSLANAAMLVLDGFD